MPPPSGSVADLHALADRVEALASRFDEIEMEVRSTALAVDEKSLRELRRTLEALSKRDPKFEERMTNKVDVIADRLQTLAKTVSTTGSANAAREGDIATLRRELDGGNSRVETAMAELRRSVDPSSIDELRRAIAALSEQKLPRKLDSRIDGLTGKVDVIAQRLDTLATTISTTAAGLSGREGDLAALRRRFEEENSRVEGVIAELRKAVDPRSVPELREAVRALSEKAVALERGNQRGLVEVSGKIEILSSRFDTLADWASTTGTFLAGRDEEIAALRTNLLDADAKLDSAVGELREAVGGLTAQVAALDDVASGDVARALEGSIEGVSAHVEDLGRRLESLETSVAATASGYAEKEAELAELGRGFDEARERVESLAGDFRQTLENMPAPGPDPALVERLDTLAQQVEELAGQVEARPALEIDEELLLGLTRRVDSLERDIEETVDNAITRVRAAWELDRDSLISEVDTVAGTLRAELASIEERRPEVETEKEMGVLRGAIDALTIRVASSEEDLAAVAEAPLIVARLDDLTRRLESIERERSVPVVVPEPVLGDGRFRVEMRGLELRIDHAEETARESRDAVLVQLERLASRIDMRLDRLENTKNPPYEPSEITAGGAQVVPIRGNEA